MSDYSSNFPQQRPTLSLDFANSGKLDSRLSYSRSSTGTYLSNEKSLNSENLLLQSQDFDTTWSKSSLNVPTGGQPAPDGTSTAWLLTTAASGTGSPFLFQNPAGAVANNTVCTYVMHIKAGTASHAYISFRGQSSSAAAWALIDFASPTSPTTGGSLGSISATSVALGNSWYRVALTFNTGTISSGYPYVYIGASDGTSPDSTGRVTWTYSGETIYAWGAQLSSTNSKAYDSPTTTQISREYSPLLKTASADEPRFEYASDGQSEGLLIESQATNLQRYGSAFESWSDKSSTTVTSNAAIAPNGLLESDLAVATSANIYHYVFDSGATIANATQYTGSCYVKKAGQRYIQITGGTTTFGSAQYATFDLDDGSIDLNGGVTASAVSVGNGWYRITATMTSTASGSGGMAIAFANSATANRLTSFSGNDYDGVLCWGWQLETGSSASSLVNSGSLNSTISRASDSCSVDLDGILADGQDVTLYAEGDFGDPDVLASNRIGAILQKDSSNYINLYNGAARSGTGYVVAGGVAQAAFTSSVTTGEFKSAISVKPNSFNYASNGIAGAEDTSATVPNYNSLHLGEWYNGTLQLDGTLKRVSLYGQALSSTELAALTS